MMDAAAMRQLLREKALEGETLTTIGEVELPTHDPDADQDVIRSVVVKLVISQGKTEIIEIASIVSRDDRARKAFVHTIMDYWEVPYEYPVLLVSLP